ncbi:MAG: amino acid ABC transporter permease [Faecalibacterium sp.]
MTFIEVTLSLLEGFQTTCLLFVLVLVVSLPLGLVISFGSMNKFAPLRAVTRFVIWVIRGTPLMLQIITVFYMPGLLFGIPVRDRFIPVVIAFIINYSVYFSEIYRAGIEAIPQGQYEAGQVLGMTKKQIFFHVILLQVIKRIVPPTTNEIITLVKDTALARAISVVEVTKAAQEIVAGEGIIWPLFYTAVFYLAAVGVLTIVLGKVEQRLNYYTG